MKFDSCLFIGQSYFFNDESQKFLIFPPIFETFTRLAGFTESIIAWQSRVLSNEKIRPTTANYSLSPKLKRHN